MRRHTTYWMTNLRSGSGTEKDAVNNVHQEPGLMCVNIANNEISDKGAIALADSLKVDLWIKGHFSFLFISFIKTNIILK